MENCSTCRFSFPEDGLTYCERIKVLGSASDGLSPEIEVEVTEAPGAYGEVRTRVTLVVVPTFGCVLWEEP